MSTVAKASITLVSISDAYAVSLAPSMCVIHADYDGSHPVLTNAYTLITVYCGEVKVPFTVDMITSSHISINYSLSKIDDCTYRLAITDLHYSLLEGGLDITVKPNDYTTLNGRFLFTVERESTMLDWIQAWESNKTTIGATSIITPKLFVGKKITGSYDSLAEVPGLTGVYIGPSENDSCGLYGYKNSIEIFHLDETGGKIGGWDLSQDGLYSSNGKLRILSDGSIRAVNDEFDTIWEVCADGSASFALGNVKFYANGNAEFKGKITSSEGNIAGWTITDSLLHCVPIALSATGKYIALANISSYPLLADGSWNGNHFNWVQQYGGAALYYTSSSNFGFIAYNKSAKQVFAAGSTNFIAGWSFDETALWIGTKNNNSNQYTGTSGSLTIGSEGLRGSTWYINANGTASFVKGLVTFGEISGTIVGWTLTGSKIATNYIALTSAAGSSGLYMTASANGQFIAKGPDAMENFINDNGGIYLKVSSDSANLGAYNSKGSRLFKIQSNGTCYIAGWSFDETSLWTGTQVTSGFTASGNISIGPNGLRGYKWRLENDGSGALAGGQIAWSKDGSGSLAGGNISWDASGNVTFSSAVSLSWTKGIDEAKAAASSASSAAATAQSTADGANTKYTNMLGTYLTHIGSDGIYTGTLTADQINGLSCTFKQGSIGGWTINSDHITKNDIYLGSNGDIYCSYNSIEYWRIDNLGKAVFAQGQVAFSKDGSGSLAGGNISWDAYGNLVFTTQASYTSGSNDMNTSFGAVLKISASTGIIESTAKNAPSYSTATSYLSSNGIFSNIAGINGMPSSSGYTHRGAIVGLGFANVSKSTWAMDANETIVTGVYGRASNSGTAPAYGGFFYSLFAGGLVLGRKCVSGTSDSTVYLSDSHTLVIGYTSATATVYLPSNPKEGQIVVFKQWWTGKMRITPYTGQSLYDDSTENDYYDCTEGQTVIAVFSIGYITSGNTTTKKEAWLVGRYKF